MLCIILTLENGQGGRGKKRCHFSPEGDIIDNAITRKCKLGMLTYITMDIISLCPPEWYQSAKFRVLAHALYSRTAAK